MGLDIPFLPLAFLVYEVASFYGCNVPIGPPYTNLHSFYIANILMLLNL
jgi:hypothetical protein